MNRIDQAFKRLKKEGKKAFIPYVTAGDPDMGTSKEIIKGLASAGADIIEIGIPFSDPLADGPTIQRAVERSLSAGCSVRKVMSMVKEIRAVCPVPLVFMTYFNIVLNYGLKRFIADSIRNGVDGVIIPDLPMEEAGELINKAKGKDFSVILLSAPTTPIGRFRKIAGLSNGFVYYVSLTGVTGARGAIASKLKSDIIKMKRTTSMPICVGFGVSKPLQARQIAEVADGVIVGSAIINILEKNIGSRKNILNGIEKFARSIANAVHASGIN